MIARNSAYAYKGRSVDVRQIGRELGVRYVVEGSVRRSGERLRITAQLVETESGAHIWSGKVEGGIAEQTAQTLRNIIAIVEAGGGRSTDIVKVTVYLKDMAQFAQMDASYKTFFPENPPARTTIQAQLWGEGRLIVIDAIAKLG